MDRPLSKQERRSAGARRALRWALPGIVLLVLLMLISGWIRPSVARSRIRTARVERGLIEASIEARGKLVPATEHVISSPINTSVKRILLQPGARVEPGQAIVQLDVEATRLALNRLEDQVALKQNQQKGERLRLEQTLSQLRSRRDIKALELEAGRLDLARSGKLHDLGLIGDERHQKAETDAGRLAIELAQLEQAIQHAEHASQLTLEGLVLELGILDKERAEAARRLELASATADRSGILTWVVDSEGASVQQGQELARIADLDSFRVEAEVSDIHAAHVAPGMAARVRVGDQSMEGAVSNVHPTVKDGILGFEVRLDDSSHSDLRHNLRVDVYVVTERKIDVLRVRRGPFASVEGNRTAFVVRGERAVRTPVELGLSNFDYYEVVSGLDEDDEVIISDMKSHLHVKEVLLK